MSSAVVTDEEMKTIASLEAGGVESAADIVLSRVQKFFMFMESVESISQDDFQTICEHFDFTDSEWEEMNELLLEMFRQGSRLGNERAQWWLRQEGIEFLEE